MTRRVMIEVALYMYILITITVMPGC